MKESTGEDVKQALGAEGADQLMQQMKNFCKDIKISFNDGGMVIQGETMPGFEVRGCIVKIAVAHGGMVYENTFTSGVRRPT